MKIPVISISPKSALGRRWKSGDDDAAMLGLLRSGTPIAAAAFERGMPKTAADTITATQLGGLLNSKVWESRKKQQEGGPRFKEWHLDKGDTEKRAMMVAFMENNRVELDAFFDEIVKLGYSPAGHKILGEAAAKKMGPMSEEAKKTMVEGSVGADMGIRFPLLPWSDQLHAFPNQTKEQIQRQVDEARRRGSEAIALAVAEGGPLATVRATRGLMDIGEGAHTIADFGAHFEKPRETGAEHTTVRELMRKMPEPFFGGMLSLAEHLRTGYKLDEMDPGSSKADRRTLKRIRSYGSEARSEIERTLADKYGLEKEEAKRRTEAFMKGLRPPLPSRALAVASRNASYAGSQVARALKGVREVRQGILEI
jgi:hypothetical protein